MRGHKKQQGMKSLLSYVLAAAMLTTSIPAVVFGSTEELSSDYLAESYVEEEMPTVAAPEDYELTTEPEAAAEEAAIPEENIETVSAEDILSDGSAAAEASSSVEAEKTTESGLKVQVNVPADVLPEGSVVEVADVPETEVETLTAQIKADLEGQLAGEIVKVLAADINFMKDGISLVPGTDVKVTMIPSDEVKAELKEKEEKGLALSLVYVPAEGKAELVADEKIQEKTLEGVTFESVLFPRYAIVATAEAAEETEEAVESAQDEVKEAVKAVTEAAEEVKEETAEEPAAEEAEEAKEEADELTDGVEEEALEAAGEAEEQEQISSAKVEGVRSGYYTIFTAELTGAKVTASVPYYFVSNGTTMEVSLADTAEYESIIARANYGKAITDLKAVEIRFADRRGRRTMLFSTGMTVELSDTGAEKYVMYEPYRGWYGTELYQLGSSRTPKFNLYSYSDSYVFAGLKADGIDRAAGVTRRGRTSFDLNAGNTGISVVAERNTFSGSVSMEAVPVAADVVTEAVSSVLPEGKTAKSIQAFDISFHNSNDGVEVEPNKEVTVTIALPLDEEAEYSLVHVKDNGEAETVENAQFSAEGVTFSAGEFSVYAVVEESTAAEARLTVNFYGKAVPGSDPVEFEKITTVYVKNADLNNADGRPADEKLAEIVYDPGAGQLEAGELFKGWSIDTAGSDDGADYTTTTTVYTIESIREYLKTLTIKEGDVLDIYAMIFKAHSVQFRDEDNVTIHSETLIHKTGESISYTINMPYTPKGQDSAFLGWNVTKGGESAISPAPEDMPEQRYVNGTVVDISGDVTFSARPAEGFWLIFDQNGKGASYTPPQFLERGERATVPSDPTRFGYTFGGWYKEDGTTKVEDISSLISGVTLNSRTVLYAKWDVKQTANYTVIIWKQNINADGYDFEEAITLSGTVNTNVTNVTQQGSGDSAYARVNGTDKRYTGFHLKDITPNVKIVPEGTAVVNVRYDRNSYTFTFWANRRGDFVWKESGVYWADTPRINIYSVTRLYDQDISDIWSFTGTNGVNYPEENAITSWYPQGSSTYTARITRMERMPAENITFILTHTDKTARYFHYYIETVDGEIGTRQYAGRQYNLYTDLKNDFNVVYYNDDFWQLKGFSRQAITKSDDQKIIDSDLSPGKHCKWTTLNGNYGGTDDHLYFYYTRDKYKINYMDGRYFNGNGVEMAEVNRGQLGERNGIYYEADLSTYNENGTNYYKPVYEGFVFAGWYIDAACTQKYTFTKMPLDGITVYAKWVQKQYRVFLHPNVPTDDDSLDFGNQEMSFRANYNDKIADGHVIDGTRENFELIGWYLDEACTQSFNFDAYILNDTTVTKEYSQVEDTELDKYGNAIESGNNDAKEGRFWITRKLDLYAKWRAKLEGARGIRVEYNPNDTKNNIEGTNAPLDNLSYADNAKAAGGAASQPTDDKYQFLHWVIQTWNGAEYVDKTGDGAIVYPGESFTVLKTDAKSEDVSMDDPEYVDGEVYKKYTVRLRAEYGPKKTPTPTHIYWYGNGGTLIQDVEASTDYKVTNNHSKQTVEYTDLQINEKIPIVPATSFNNKGKVFLGWARVDTTNDGSVFNPSEKALSESDLFLIYDRENNQFKTTDGKVVTHVAADENSPYHDMYAVWMDGFYVYHSGAADGAIELLPMPESGKYDLTQNLTENTLYGGYYSDYAGKGSYQGDGIAVTDGKVYTGDTTSWSWEKRYTREVTTTGGGIGNNMTPVAGETYYVKEVPQTYLKTVVYVIYDDVETSTEHKINDMYTLTNVDDANYDSVGFIYKGKNGISGATTAGTIYSKFNVTKNKTGKTENFTSNIMFDTEGYLGVLNKKDFLIVPATFNEGNYTGTSAAFTDTPYWVTPDGISVTGTQLFKVYIGNGQYLGWERPGISKQSKKQSSTMVEATIS